MLAKYQVPQRYHGNLQFRANWSEVEGTNDLPGVSEVGQSAETEPLPRVSPAGSDGHCSWTVSMELHGWTPSWCPQRTEELLGVGKTHACGEKRECGNNRE